MPTPPHLDREERVLFPVSTAATLNLAATAAQCARIWQRIDAGFSSRCLAAAERAWTAALRNPEVYFVADFPGSGMYGNGELSDEFFWAAAELFVTTGAKYYRDFIDNSPYRDGPDREASWGYVAPLGLLSLAAVKTASARPRCVNSAPALWPGPTHSSTNAAAPVIACRSHRTGTFGARTACC